MMPRMRRMLYTGKEAAKMPRLSPKVRCGSQTMTDQSLSLTF